MEGARNESLWHATADATAYPQLESDLEVEVVVVGGGIAGMATAAFAAERGVGVALVEAEHLGFGATGNTTAKLSSLHSAIYARLMWMAGEDTARSYAEANETGIDLIEELVERHGIDCDFRRRPNFTYATAPVSRRKIEDEVSAARSAGLAADLVATLDELPFGIECAVRLDRQAEVHPQRLLVGLARALDGAGVRIFERTRVVGASRRGSRLAVTTLDGPRLSAGHLVIATHAPILDRGVAFARMSTERSYLVAVESGRPPLGAMYIGVDEPTGSLRSVPIDGRELLLVGGESHPVGDPTGPDRYERLARFAAEHFDAGEPLYRWSAQDGMPVDGRPLVGPAGPLSDRILMATGFAKWGMAAGVAAGRALADRITGAPPAWARAFDPGRFDVRALRGLAEHNTRAGVHFMRDRLRRGSAPELAPGEGAIVADGLGQAAIACGQDGRLHSVSARCTHLGCIVAWNGAEESWDCPCHASRFAIDGRVLEGPATRPLEPRRLEGSDAG